MNLIKELSSWFNSSLSSILPESVGKLIKFLESRIYPKTRDILSLDADNTESSSPIASDYSIIAIKCVKTQRWQTAILDVLDSCIQSIIAGDWRERMTAALAQQLRLYVNQPQDRSFLLRVIGFSLSKVANTTFVVDHIYLAFKNANHSNQSERMGCALLMGHAAAVHS